MLIMKKRDQDIIHSIKNTIHVHAPDAKIILYGSRARNTADADSDWDILVLLNKEKIESYDYDCITYKMYELGWSFGEHFSTKIYTNSQWAKRYFTPFYKNIEKEGIVL